MALGDFFRINLPYGIKRNSDDEWFAFNREYMPLGYNTIKGQVSLQDESAYSELPIFTKYKGLTDKKLLKIVNDDVTAIHRNKEGEIEFVFLYKDDTNPQSNPKAWETYLNKIKELSKLEQK